MKERKFVFCFRRGSVLVFSLVVLSFLLVSALSIAAISVMEKRSSYATEKSSRSYQIAESGAEVMLKKIYKDSTVIGSTPISSLGSCNNGIISGASGQGVYTVTFYDGSNGLLSCSATRNTIVTMKVDGVSGGTTRSIEVDVRASNLLLYYPLDEASSGGIPNTATDLSGFSNTGTLTGAVSWTTGKTINALQFSGGYLLGNNDSKKNLSFDNEDSFSVCAWINPTTTAPLQQSIVNKLDSSAPFSGWGLNLYDGGSSSNRLHFVINRNYPSNSLSVVATSNTIATDTWQHVCATYDGSSSTNGVEFYINGSVQGSKTVIANTLSGSPSNNLAVSVGMGNGSVYPFSGKIDQVRVYGYKLSSSDVTALYSNNQ
ncbi:MAG: LamG domain-containing protein [Candidatus Moranbacteria bacterium]|nr:LamG domain-containing protein [Candidatus Moranbacteria bacterium]